MLILRHVLRGAFDMAMIQGVVLVSVLVYGRCYSTAPQNSINKPDGDSVVFDEPLTEGGVLHFYPSEEPAQADRAARRKAAGHGLRPSRPSGTIRKRKPPQPLPQPDGDGQALLAREEHGVSAIAVLWFMTWLHNRC